MVAFTEAAGIVPHIAREEADAATVVPRPRAPAPGPARRGRQPIGQELRPTRSSRVDSAAARVLRAHGLTSGDRPGRGRPAGRRGRPARPPAQRRRAAGHPRDRPGRRHRQPQGGLRLGRVLPTRPSTSGCGPSRPTPTPREAGHRSSAGGCSCSSRRRPQRRRGRHTRALAAGLLRDAEDPVEVTAHRYPWNAGRGPCTASPTAAPARSGLVGSTG